MFWAAEAPNKSKTFMKTETDKTKVAIVHDWLYGGGAEKVVLALHQMYPDAPIYTSYCAKQWQEKLFEVGSEAA